MPRPVEALESNAITRRVMSKPELESLETLIKPGIYQHYKGGKYQVIGGAYLEATLEKMVVYIQLKSDGKSGPTFIRPYLEFFQLVDNAGESVRRFNCIG